MVWKLKLEPISFDAKNDRAGHLVAHDDMQLARHLGRLQGETKYYTCKRPQHTPRAHRRFLAERTNQQHTLRHFFDQSVPTPGLIDPHIRAP